MKPLRLLPFATAVALGALMSTQASAHLVNTDVGEFYAGMLHPLTSAEHLLPTLALALLAIQCSKRAARATLLAFPVALLAGILAGSRFPPFAFFHLANLVALVGLGGLLALGDRLNRIGPVAVGALALLTGVILGYRSGIDMAVSKVAAQFIPGVALTGLIVVALVAAWVPAASSRPGRTLRTLTGAGFAVAGMVLLMQLLTDGALPSARGAKLPGQEALLAMLQAHELSMPLVVGALLAVMVWGAGHALTPGHGKTVVAAYLIGSHSTPWHALYLGLTVTLTHTLGVFALGLVALFASQYVLPEQFYPWLGSVSGLIVVGLGAAMLWKRVRPLLARRGHDHHHGSHHHGHDHPHEHEHLHDHDHPHDHEYHHTHDYGHGHAHLPPGADGSPVTWRYLLGLGISGGLLPCPSALVLLVTAVSINRVALGMLLVVAFSLGLAGVLTMVGLLFVKGSRLVQQLPRVGAWGRLLPAASALVIMVIGIWLTAEAVSRLQV
ncbi:MAG: HupE/UreJ family protein [Candidatus Entotheonellia bacterium]